MSNNQPTNHLNH